MRVGKKLTPSNRLLSYGVALLSTALALAIALLLDPAIDPAPTSLFFMAVMVTAWYGGLRPGLVATMLSALAINYYFVEPYHSLKIADLGSLVRVGVYVTAALLISGLNESRRIALHREQKLRAVSETAQREAQAAKERLETVLSSIDDGFYVLDRNWRYTYVSDRYCEMTGMQREKLLGHKIWDLFPDAVDTDFYVQLQRAMTEQTPAQFEYFDATWNHWYEYRVYPSPDGITVLIAEITDRKQTEAALQQSKQRLHILANSVPSIVWTAAPDGTIIWTSDDWYTYTGITPQQNACNWTQVLHPDDMKRCLNQWHDALERGVAYEIEVRNRRHDGEYRWFLTKALPMRDDGGWITAWFGSTTDIHDKKLAEEALRQSEARFRRIFECNMVPMGIWNISGGILQANHALLDLIGYTRQELEAGQINWQNITPPEWLSVDKRSLAEIATKGFSTPFEKEYIHKQGHRIPILIGGASFLDDPESGIFFAIDLSDRKQAEVALQQREAELRLVTNAVPALISFVDSNQCYRFNNRAYEEWFGHLAAEIYGKHLREVLGETAYEEIRPYVEQVLAGQQVSFESQVAYKDGGTRYVSATYVPRINSQGTVEGFVALVSDISDRKRAEAALRQSEARYRYLIEVTPQLVWTADAQGYNDYVNQQMCDYIGLPCEQLLGLDWQTVIHPEDGERVRRRWMESVQNGTPYEAEYRLRRADGVYRWQLVRAIPFKDEQNRGIQWVGVSTDIHDKHELEEQRSRLLQQEQAAREQAERANRIKDEFLAVLSHELRSPLNPILGWSKLLLGGKLDEVRAKQALVTIERNAKLQAELIEDLLDVSRILRGKLSLTVSPINLALTIKAAIETVRLAAEAKSIQIETMLDPEVGLVLGDSTRLQQVVWNLLSNAVKFTPAGGRVEVRLSKGLGTRDWGLGTRKEAEEQSPIANYAQIQVSDTGKGINPDFLPYVFDYFRQEDGATTRKFGGLGLGLAIVRHLVELHGGTIQADSPGENLGATFTVKIPLMPAQPTVNQPLQSSEQSLDLSGVQVLVVDDDTDTRDFVAFLLEQAGARVIAVTTAGEAFATLTQSQPDILLSDIGMPDIDGYMLLRQVRTLPPEQGGKIPAIALTAYAGEYDQKQALEAGFQLHLAKPIEPNELIVAIATLIRGD
nr:PAS domain S-box protein [Chlorogloeopsis fritschii]